jgi:DegV family protein with EDD domain
MADEGKEKKEILDAIQSYKEKVKVLFIPRTLKYLIMGGRIGRAKGLIASILEINPILTIHLGEVSQFKTTRRWNQAKNELIEAMKTMVKDPKKLTAYVTDSDAPEEAEDMLQRIKNEVGPREIYRSYIGSIVGIHLGPDSIAVTFFED